MLLLLILTYYSLIKKNQSPVIHEKKSFSFSIDNTNQITLYNTKRYLNYISNDEKKWYYVHFLINDLSNIPKSIAIDSTDLIIKDTFLLYLSYEQLSLISNITLARKHKPEDKIKEGSVTIEKAQYLLVYGPHNFVLDSNSKLFSIESRKSSDSYLINFRDNSITKKRYLIKILSEDPSVKSIVPYSKPVLRNNLMTGFTQKNTREFFTDEKSGILYTKRYLNEKGIDGQGEIVTVVDSPLDYHHSMFYDPNCTFQLNTPLKHRKIVYYNYYGSIESLAKDIYENEHGTHVAGTIAGESICSNKDGGFDLFDGNAPKAKLIFFPFLLFSLEEEVSVMNDFKSRISSNSWDAMGFSDSDNFQYGEASHKNPQVMFVFAAGNEYSDGNFSVADPSGSKNVLCVGAIDDLFETMHTSRIVSSDDSSVYLDVEQLYMIDPFFGGTIGTNKSESDIFVFNAEETSDCKFLHDSTVYLAYASDRDKVRWIDECILYSTKGVFISTDVDKVKLLLKSSFVSIFDTSKLNTSKPYQHSSYSSAGPANRGAMKPDVLGPGTRISSAKSYQKKDSFYGCRENGTSDVTTMEGTSQATPNIAGAASLIRQYFEFGNWTSKVDLDGATMRALLINSCVHPQGSKTVDVLHGHGVVDLSTILPFEGEFGVQITKQFYEKDHPSINEYGHKVANLTVLSKEKRLQITLSYLDAMLNKDSPLLLAHDLDLVVVSPSGKLYKGDHIETGDSQHLSTNEKVIVDREEVEIGQYSIHVFSGAFIDSGINDVEKEQNFSVVASGNIENGYLSFSDAKGCIGCDKCDPDHPLHCKCNDSSLGSVCQAHVTVKKEESFSLTLKAHEIGRIRIKEKNFVYQINPIKNVMVEALNDDRGYSTVWIDKDCHLEIGEYELYLGNFKVNKTLKSDINNKGSSLCIAIFNNNYEDANFNVKIEHKNNMTYLYIGVGCFAGVIIILIIVIVIVKTSRKQKLKGNGFTEIKSLN